MASGYAELHCRSKFRFPRGVSRPEELVTAASCLGFRARALADECSLAEAARAHVAAKNKHLKLIFGSELIAPANRGFQPVTIPSGHAPRQ